MIDELVNWLEDCCGSVVLSCYYQYLVAEAWDSSETQPLEAATKQRQSICDSGH
jgi:hypothetical protein